MWGFVEFADFAFIWASIVLFFVIIYFFASLFVELVLKKEDKFDLFSLKLREQKALWISIAVFGFIIVWLSSNISQKFENLELEKRILEERVSNLENDYFELQKDYEEKTSELHSANEEIDALYGYMWEYEEVLSRNGFEYNWYLLD